MSDESWRVICAIESDTFREHNDCALRAVSIATGLPYRIIRTAFYKTGRRSGHGVKQYMIKTVINSLGYSLQEISSPGNTFQEAISNLKERQWSYPVLLSSKNHIACFRDGELQDRVAGNLDKVTGTWIVTQRAA